MYYLRTASAVYRIDMPDGMGGISRRASLVSVLEAVGAALNTGGVLSLKYILSVPHSWHQSWFHRVFTVEGNKNGDEHCHYFFGGFLYQPSYTLSH